MEWIKAPFRTAVDRVLIRTNGDTRPERKKALISEGLKESNW
jgi:hypothetical protein